MRFHRFMRRMLIAATIFATDAVVLRAAALVPLYRSAAVRDGFRGAVAFVQSRGVQAHFFSVRSVECDETRCRLTLFAQPNLLSRFDAPDRIVVAWNLDDPNASYEMLP